MPSLATLVNLDERALHSLHTGLGTCPRNGDCVIIDIEAELVEPPEPEAERLQQARARGRMRGGEPIAADKMIDNRPVAPPLGAGRVTERRPHRLVRRIIGPGHRARQTVRGQEILGIVEILPGEPEAFW